MFTYLVSLLSLLLTGQPAGAANSQQTGASAQSTSNTMSLSSNANASITSGSTDGSSYP